MVGGAADRGRSQRTSAGAAPRARLAGPARYAGPTSPASRQGASAPRAPASARERRSLGPRGRSQGPPTRRPAVKARSICRQARPQQNGLPPPPDHDAGPARGDGRPATRPAQDRRPCRPRREPGRVGAAGRRSGPAGGSRSPGRGPSRPEQVVTVRRTPVTAANVSRRVDCRHSPAPLVMDDRDRARRAPGGRHGSVGLGPVGPSVRTGAAPALGEVASARRIEPSADRGTPDPTRPGANRGSGPTWPRTPPTVDPEPGRTRRTAVTGADPGLDPTRRPTAAPAGQAAPRA